MRIILTTFLVSIIGFSCLSPQEREDVTQSEDETLYPSSIPVKSVLLYDTIKRWPIDTILSALSDINKVIASIEPRGAAYSLWKVQSDTIPDYRYLIQGHWPDQQSYDSIHINPDFRKALDDNVHIFTETRKWDLYRRYELIPD